ncbi:heavy-metal-associated domain-containing protein [Mannheimia varigena]|uniref:heavy-metal-associated domain-containing protein n=1 Tax=Mannheimia varigena TaxID=85404 RepID=UPI0015B3E988|nr:heavy-metal-associated domain-containing protein [Mannheimia varigena]MDY2947244.1 heavy-metal-associated domain-containing protein [Mannheimia varigena]QLD33981.1 heavy-metal-associated domain-containing protein [Mannheimia varigena]
MKKYIASLLLAFGLMNSTYAQEKAAQVDTQQAEKTVVLHIPEMYCQLCVYLVNKELRAVEGVISTKASMKERKATVVAQADVDNQKLIQAVGKIHYSAKVM